MRLPASSTGGTLARPLRIDFDGAWHHVMNRGAARRSIFPSASHRCLFLRILGETSERYRVEVHAYCLMDNHYHLLLHTPHAGLSRAMRHLDGVYTQTHNRRAGIDGPLFRGRYRSVLVQSDAHMLCVSRYIHRNPVDAGIVERPEDHEPSSYRAFAGLEPVPVWLRTRETLDRFGSDDPMGGYVDFVASGTDDRTSEFFGAGRRKPVFGSNEFRSRIRQRLAKTPVLEDPEVPDTKLVVDAPSMEVIAGLVCQELGLRMERLRSGPCREHAWGLARGAMVYFGRSRGGRTLRAVSQWIGYRHPSAAGRAEARLRRRMGQDPAVARLVASIGRRLARAPAGGESRVQF